MHGEFDTQRRCLAPWTVAAKEMCTSASQPHRQQPVFFFSPVWKWPSALLCKHRNLGQLTSWMTTEHIICPELYVICTTFRGNICLSVSHSASPPFQPFGSGSSIISFHDTEDTHPSRTWHSSLVESFPQEKSLRRKQHQAFDSLTDDPTTSLVLAKAIAVFPSYPICKHIDFGLMHVYSQKRERALWKDSNWLDSRSHF